FVILVFLFFINFFLIFFFFFSSRRRHTRFSRDWSSDVCSSDLTRVFKNIYAFSSFKNNNIFRLHVEKIKGTDFYYSKHFNSLFVGGKQAYQSGKEAADN